MTTPFTSISISEGIARNAKHRCRTPGCHVPRYRLDAWCLKHGRRAKAYGHPLAIPLQTRQWKPQRKEVEAILKANPMHPGLVQAMSLLQQWMQRAALNPQAYKGAEQVYRLVSHGVTPLDVIREAAALYLWSRDNPGQASSAWPDDTAADFALARAVFRLAPTPRRVLRSKVGIAGDWKLKLDSDNSYQPKPRPSSLREVGKYLRQLLAPLVVGLSVAVQQSRAQKKDPQALLKLPFAVHHLT